MGNQTISNNVSTALSANSFTRNSYGFAGWNTKADGSGTSYTDGQVVTNLGNITLFAQWKKPVNYAVQIYGINEDVDANGETLGLTFGPAIGEDYNNKYITHAYEETSPGSGVYNVKIITHTVAANGDETTTEEFLTNSASENVIRTEAEKNKYNKNIHEMTWAQIAAVTDKTEFLDCMLCGDTKKVELYLNDTVGTGITYNQYGDGAGMLYGSVNQYYRMWNPAYNNPNAAYNNSAVGQNIFPSAEEQELGLNGGIAGGYSVSHIRATLIGQNAKTNTDYAGDVNLSETNSLYSCLPSTLKSVISAKKVRYVTGYTSYDLGNYSLNDDIADKIWAFSEREMYGTATYTGTTTEGLGNDGHGYSKFANTDSKYYISSYNSNSATQRICYNELGSTYNWWLRTPGISDPCSVDCTYDSGKLSYNLPYEGNGLAFGFCIK